MSSPRKQQKKSKRAASKARANRIARNGGERKDPFAPSIYDRMLDMEDDDDLTPEYILQCGLEANEFQELFEDMKVAQATSMKDMCLAFLDSDAMTIFVTTFNAEELTDFIFGWMVSYKMWLDESEDEMAAADWVESTEFQTAYVAACDEMERRYPTDAPQA